MSERNLQAGASAAAGHESKLKIVLGLTLTYLIAEVIGGIVTGSLALLADAGHMLTDVAGLALALIAIRFAKKSASPTHTYGYYRTEILAALTNAVVLLGISAFVLVEAYRRFRSPPEIMGPAMLVVAGVGLIVNLVGIVLLRGGGAASLNVKGAYFEVLSDLVTSVGVIVAAVVIITTGWRYADPLISAGIGLFIVPRTWILLRDAISILLEGTPSDVDLAALRNRVTSIPGIVSIHDVHVWSLTSGVNAASLHVVADSARSHKAVLSEVTRLVSAEFPISHVTAQIEEPGWESNETHL